LSVRDVNVLGERNDAEDGIDVYDRDAMLAVDNEASDLESLQRLSDEVSPQPSEILLEEEPRRSHLQQFLPASARFSAITGSNTCGRESEQRSLELSNVRGAHDGPRHLACTITHTGRRNDCEKVVALKKRKSLVAILPRRNDVAAEA
jgi:hypothetical protein